MTSPDDARSADPDPAETAGLEPGGGVAPGDTPPAEASTAAVQGHEEGRGTRWGTVVGLVVVALFVLGFTVAYAIGGILG